MPFPLASMRRLYERGPGARGLVVDRDGVMLGPNAVLVRRTPQGSRVASIGDIAVLTRVVFGEGARLDRLPLALSLIAKALDASDVVKAQLLGLEIPLYPLDDDQLTRLGVAASLMKYDPDQPRDERGRWTSGGDDARGAVVAGGREGADASVSTRPVRLTFNDDGSIRTDAGGGIRPSAGSASGDQPLPVAEGSGDSKPGMSDAADPQLSFEPAPHQRSRADTDQLQRIIDDPTIRAQMQEAWAASNPNGPDRQEHGFWIIQDAKTGKLSTLPSASAGTKDEIRPGAIPANAIAFFHIHPSPPDIAIPGPSPKDLIAASNGGLTGIIGSHRGIYYYGPPVRLRGDRAR